VDRALLDSPISLLLSSPPSPVQKGEDTECRLKRRLTRRYLVIACPIRLARDARTMRLPMAAYIGCVFIVIGLSSGTVASIRARARAV